MENQKVVDKPKTQLEKIACDEAKKDAIEQAIECKKVKFANAMRKLVAQKEAIIDLTERLAKAEEKYNEIRDALGVTKEDEKSLF